MPLPRPEPGLVISYAYLWHAEWHEGREEGLKDRPCVIVLSAERAEDGATIVTVLQVTHLAPNQPSEAVELPFAVKRHLGLDWERSWVVLTEANRFVWPGFDLRPVPGTADRFAYGPIPPRLFDRIVSRLKEVWSAGHPSIAPRMKCT